MCLCAQNLTYKHFLLQTDMSQCVSLHSQSVTLQLLTKPERSSPEHSEKEEDEEENDEERESDVQPTQPHLNGQREEEEPTDTDPEDRLPQVEEEDVTPAEEKKEEETEEIQSDQEVVEERNKEKVVEEKEVEVNVSTEHDVQDQDSQTTHKEAAESDVTPTQEVTAELPDDISPQEVKVVDESVTGPVDAAESTLTLGGPPKNPPPPPAALQEDSSATPAQINRYEH